MNIFIYGDESGVFDKKHHDYFVLGGLIFFEKSQRDNLTRRYLGLERTILNEQANSDNSKELKAYNLKNKDKRRLLGLTKDCTRYAFIIDLPRVHETLFNNRKSKQRFQDYVYKVGLKKVFQNRIKSHRLTPQEVENVYIKFDEHTTATNGRYELKEAIEQEFKYGTYNQNYSCYFPPIFPHIKSVNLEFKDSRAEALIRASDICANFALRCIKDGDSQKLDDDFEVVRFP